MTPAGQKMLDRYAAAKSANQLDAGLVTCGGDRLDGEWLRLHIGCGADAACARKLAREGHVILREGSRGRRWIKPTGR